MWGCFKLLLQSCTCTHKPRSRNAERILVVSLLSAFRETTRTHRADVSGKGQGCPSLHLWKFSSLSTLLSSTGCLLYCSECLLCCYPSFWFRPDLSLQFSMSHQTVSENPFTEQQPMLIMWMITGKCPSLYLFTGIETSYFTGEATWPQFFMPSEHHTVFREGLWK